MKAKVVEIISASEYVDGKRRATLQFSGADSMYKRLRVTEEMLGREVKLDEEVDLEVIPLVSVLKFRERPVGQLLPTTPPTEDEVIHGS